MRSREATELTIQSLCFDPIVLETMIYRTRSEHVNRYGFMLFNWCYKTNSYQNSYVVYQNEMMHTYKCLMSVIPREILQIFMKPRKQKLLITRFLKMFTSSLHS